MPALKDLRIPRSHHFTSTYLMAAVLIDDYKEIDIKPEMVPSKPYHGWTEVYHFVKNKVAEIEQKNISPLVEFLNLIMQQSTAEVHPSREKDDNDDWVGIKKVIIELPRKYFEDLKKNEENLVGNHDKVAREKERLLNNLVNELKTIGFVTPTNRDGKIEIDYQDLINNIKNLENQQLIKKPPTAPRAPFPEVKKSDSSTGSLPKP